MTTGTGGADVTVVIPTHNRRALLARTLDSVLRQTGIRVEVVVVDDGGADGTSAYVRDLDLESVQVVRHEQSRGVSVARNTGLARAGAPWVAFVDDDDLWAPNKLRAQLDALAARPGARWCCAAAVHVDAALKVNHLALPPDPDELGAELLKRQAIPGGGSGVLVATDLARQLRGFDESISIVADWDFYLRLSLAAPAATVEEPVIAYFVHSDSMYHDPPGLLRELRYMAAKHGAVSDGRSFLFDHKAWYVRAAWMARHLGDKRTTALLAVRGIPHAGLRAMAGVLVPGARRNVVREDPVQVEVGRVATAPWLERYASWSF